MLSVWSRETGFESPGSVLPREKFDVQSHSQLHMAGAHVAPALLNVLVVQEGIAFFQESACLSVATTHLSFARQLNRQYITTVSPDRAGVKE
jgi:hypothetical protein